jgi:RNAse (barnase) inhibitor barstar
MDIHYLNGKNLSARGVFATMICSTFKFNFNDQMGKDIDDLWMVKFSCIFKFLIINNMKLY